MQLAHLMIILGRCNMLTAVLASQSDVSEDKLNNLEVLTNCSRCNFLRGGPRRWCCWCAINAKPRCDPSLAHLHLDIILWNMTTVHCELSLTRSRADLTAYNRIMTSRGSVSMLTAFETHLGCVFSDTDRHDSSSATHPLLGVASSSPAPEIAELHCGC
jgi:hypothetical protein